MDKREAAWAEYKAKADLSALTDGQAIQCFFAGRDSRDAEVSALEQRVVEAESIIWQIDRIDRWDNVLAIHDLSMDAANYIEKHELPIVAKAALEQEEDEKV